MTIAELKKNAKGLSRASVTVREPDGFYDNIYLGDLKVECICPKCGIKHVMKFHWIGRGTPRKFCRSCKGSKD